MASNDKGGSTAEASKEHKMDRARLHKLGSYSDLLGVGSAFRDRDVDFNTEKTPEQLRLWGELYTETNAKDVRSLQASFVEHVYSTLARTPFNLDTFGAYQAAAYSIRDKVVRNSIRTQQHFAQSDPKRVYYLSMEYLMGRTLQNSVVSLGCDRMLGDALAGLGYKMEEVYQEEMDAALGNGGLGRLAACFMDSLATLKYPAWGYGLRYTYGIFEQRIIGEDQIEFPDYWLTFGNPWEIPRLDVAYKVGFFGHVSAYIGLNGEMRSRWEPAEFVQAVAYDVPVPGYDTDTTINMRLWSSKPNKQFDLADFNAGQYEKSVQEKQRAENITSVLYPNDNTPAGKELRLKQQYFFVCATLQDIIRRFKKSQRPWSEFPDQVSIQLNDTHPTLGIVELMRQLVDNEGLSWDKAWTITTRVYSYTNHTVLPEALETWPVSLLTNLLPRHMRIIFDINLFFLREVEARFPNDRDRLRRMSIIEEGSVQMVRMAFLAVVGSHTVNGVARIHSGLVRSKLFHDFAEFYGETKFTNVTNGITPRRWLHVANPQLSALITKTLGSDDWLTSLDELAHLRDYANDKEFQKAFMAVKRQRKVLLAEYIEKSCGIKVSPDALFDVQVKRIHEYKRQFMNILGVVHRYLALKDMTPEQRASVLPRVVIFGGKAAPGYYIAKLIIKFINRVLNVVNADPETKDYLKVVFIVNYNVSLAELIVPASDISQHISTAGTEASGTSNMKFVLNGGLILGTMDGANIEIGEEIGWDNIFIFGAKADEVDSLRHSVRYRIRSLDPALERVIVAIQSRKFGDPEPFEPLIERLMNGNDEYLVTQDFGAYIKAQEEVENAYRDKSLWAKKAILCTAGMGKFSSDRSIVEYAEKIWHIKSCAR